MLASGEPRLLSAMAGAAARYGHAMHPETATQPAVELAHRLLHSAGSGWADRVFCLDDGYAQGRPGLPACTQDSMSSRRKGYAEKQHVLSHTALCFAMSLCPASVCSESSGLGVKVAGLSSMCWQVHGH